MSAPAGRLRVMLVLDHALFRAGVRALIERDLNAHVTAECDGAAQALRAMALDRPDIAILDISLHGEDGFALARRIRADFGMSVRCIMLSMHLSPEYVRRAFETGAAGYVVKDAGPADLTAAIRAVAAGERYVSPEISFALMDKLQQGDSALANQRLSARQLQVLRMVAQGKSTKLIARELKLSPKTVDAHRHQICQRLEVHDIAGMVRYAIRRGLVDVEA